MSGPMVFPTKSQDVKIQAATTTKAKKYSVHAVHTLARQAGERYGLIGGG
jgi:hypothetical protein